MKFQKPLWFWKFLNPRTKGSLFLKVFKNPEPEEVLWFGKLKKLEPEVINKIKELHNTAQNFHRLYYDYCSFSSNNVSLCRRFCKTQNRRFLDSENVQKPGIQVFWFWRFKKLKPEANNQLNLHSKSRNRWWVCAPSQDPTNHFLQLSFVECKL